MKKILILVNHDLVIYNFRRELVEKLIEEGNDVLISSPWGEKIDRLTSLGAKHIETHVDRRGANPWEDYKLIKHYKRIMKQYKPDVVLTYTIKPNIYGGMAAKSLKIPYIANITGLGSAVENKGLLQIITKILYKRVFKNINTVFFQNQENMDFFIENKIAIGKHELLPGSGVNLSSFNVMPYPNDEKIKFVFISRIMKEKGIDYYLNAAKHFKKKYHNLEFHICGFLEENYREEINQLVENDTIVYHGLVDDVKKVLIDMHAIIHPTYYPEGMSNVLLESAAVGRPGITSDRSGCREIIQNEVTGYLFETKNEAELFSAIDKFINLSNEDKKNMGLQARKKVENEFDRNIIVKAYLDKVNKI